MFHVFIVWPDGHTDTWHIETMAQVLKQIRYGTQGDEFVSISITYVAR